MEKYKIKNTKDLGLWIRAKRKEQEITQRQLAGLLGLGERFIVDLEAGKPTAQIGKALLVVNSLGGMIELPEIREKKSSRKRKSSE